MHELEANRTGAPRRRPRFSALQHLPISRPSVGDIDRAYYRAKTEEEEWKSKRDPVELFTDGYKGAKSPVSRLIKSKLKSLENRSAVIFALNAPYPDPNEVDQHVYA